MKWASDMLDNLYLEGPGYEAYLSPQGSTWNGTVKAEGKIVFNVVSNDFGWAKSQVELQVRKLKAKA